MSNPTIYSLLLLAFLYACNDTPKHTKEATKTQKTTTITPATPANPFVAKVETAHQKAAFLAKNAIQFDIVISFGGKERLNGTITTSTNSSQGIIDYKDGRKIYYHNDKVYFSPEMDNAASIRFAAYTWSYFFLFPYKLSDPGTHWNAYDNKLLNGQEYNSQQLTFAPGTGDDPDDWYIAYANKESNLMEVAAYIVTAHGTKEEAEKDPHAIQYKDYTMVDGIPFAQNWIFWGWRKEQGLTEELGQASLSNIKFVELTEEDFKAPEHFKTT